MQVVQEPPVVPAWVDQYDGFYGDVAECFLRCCEVNNRAVTLAKSPYVTRTPVEQSFDQFNTFVKNIILEITHRCSLEFAPTGSRLDINLTEVLPEMWPILQHDNKHEWHELVRSFKPSNVYCYFSAKYNSTEAMGIACKQAADRFVERFVAGSVNCLQWHENQQSKYFDEKTGRRKKFIARVAVDIKETKHYVVYDLSAKTNDFGSRSGMVNYEHQTRRNIVGAALEIYGILVLIYGEKSPTTGAWSDLLKRIEDGVQKENEYPFGTCLMASGSGIGKQMSLTMRKSNAEFHVPIQVHQFLMKFLSQHHSKKDT